MTTRDRLKRVRNQVSVLMPGTAGREILEELVAVLDSAVFVDELPAELAAQLVKPRAPRPSRTWRRRYRCKQHGAITGPLCGDCASAHKSPSALVEELEPGRT